MHVWGWGIWGDGGMGGWGWGDGGGDGVCVQICPVTLQHQSCIMHRQIRCAQAVLVSGVYCI